MAIIHQETKVASSGVKFDLTINLSSLLTLGGLTLVLVAGWIHSDDRNTNQDFQIAELKSTVQECVRIQSQLATNQAILTQLVNDMKERNNGR